MTAVIMAKMPRENRVAIWIFVRRGRLRRSIIGRMKPSNSRSVVRLQAPVVKSCISDEVQWSGAIRGGGGRAKEGTYCRAKERLALGVSCVSVMVATAGLAVLTVPTSPLARRPALAPERWTRRSNGLHSKNVLSMAAANVAANTTHSGLMNRSYCRSCLTILP